MAKGNGGTRAKGLRSTMSSNSLRTYQSWGDKPITVEIEDGYPIERAQAILEQVERLSDIYEIPVKKVEFVKGAAIEGVAAAMADAENGILRFGTVIQGGFKNGELGGKEVAVAAHEFAHLIPFYPKPSKPLMDRERAPKLWAKYDRQNELYLRNKTVADEIGKVYKEYKQEAKRIGFKNYAIEGGIREFAAEAFAYRIIRGAGHDEYLDRAYNLLLKIRK